MNIQDLKALIKYAKDNGCADPKISTVGNELNEWNCGSVPRPSASEIETILADYSVSKEHFCDIFSADYAKASLNSVFTVSERRILAPYLGIVGEYMAYPAPLRNFADLRLLMEDLVANGVATQGQYDKLKGVLLDQNINLDEF